jgi:hypothetical protein
MPKIELSPTEIAFGTLFIGGIGWIIGRYWDARRHFREKRDEFKRFLGQWLQSVERIQAGDAPTTYNVYVACERDLYGHFEMLRSHFWQKRKFERLCAPLRQILPDSIYMSNGDCRDVIAIPIRKLLEWL